jgi:hypothetical protein
MSLVRFAKTGRTSFRKTSGQGRRAPRRFRICLTSGRSEFVSKSLALVRCLPLEPAASVNWTTPAATHQGPEPFRFAKNAFSSPGSSFRTACLALSRRPGIVAFGSRKPSISRETLLRNRQLVRFVGEATQAAGLRFVGMSGASPALDRLAVGRWFLADNGFRFAENAFSSPSTIQLLPSRPQPRRPKRGFAYTRQSSSFRYFRLGKRDLLGRCQGGSVPWSSRCRPSAAWTSDPASYALPCISRTPSLLAHLAVSRFAFKEQ